MLKAVAHRNGGKIGRGKKQHKRIKCKYSKIKYNKRAEEIRIE